MNGSINRQIRVRICWTDIIDAMWRKTPIMINLLWIWMQQPLPLAGGRIVSSLLLLLGSDARRCVSHCKGREGLGKHDATYDGPDRCRSDVVEGRVVEIQCRGEIRKEEIN